MTTYLGKSCSFCLPWVPFVNCRQFVCLVISLLVLRAGYGIWLYQFLIIAYLFYFVITLCTVYDYKEGKISVLLVEFTPYANSHTYYDCYLSEILYVKMLCIICITNISNLYLYYFRQVIFSFVYVFQSVALLFNVYYTRYGQKKITVNIFFSSWWLSLISYSFF